MSRVIRPSGPLPPRVYWTRRVLLIAVVVLVISLIWWVFGRLTGNADESKATTPAAPTGVEQSPADPGPTDSVDQPRHHGGKSHGRNGHQEKPRRHHRVLAEPTGDCDPADVAMKIDVSDAPSGHPNSLDLVLTALATPACTLAVTPSSLVLRITSGSDIVWTSDECPDDVLAKELVVREHPPTTYRFTWNGRRSTESCSSPGRVAEPGGYWVEAALVGADAHKAYFDVTDG